MKLRVKFNKRNYLKYISHLDLMRLFQRSLNMAKIPVEYSKGFNPQPKLSIASPLSLGIASEEEYMDLELIEKIDLENFKEDMNNILPKDVQIISCIYPENNISIASMISWGLYEVIFEIESLKNKSEINTSLNRWINQDTIIISRFRKKGRKKILKDEDIKSLIKELNIIDLDKKQVKLQAILKVGENGNLRPLDFVEAFYRDNDLTIIKDSIRIKRIGLFVEEGDTLHRPF
ncbi:TIGR03936 family radical SAM-associated protein [Wansuia hejianensis]|uniref:DUF2344 domain-containing protein n=1 Tax=Wansuia hejianensis TaxID=2763667 RepID=A0A926IHL9_9FIRM|nr:TIGR03936 family radical SAM-associated protein [Wansuia hejianensis]MBC8590817.1 DUF2344 domain-containing protein [Wansuia hejianensis]